MGLFKVNVFAGTFLPPCAKRFVVFVIQFAGWVVGDIQEFGGGLDVAETE